MGLTYGFYNSLNEDRKYNAIQLSMLFDGLITDGIFMSIGSKLMVTENSGMNISVGTGRAWFDHTWTYNDSILVLTVPISEVILNRIDIVVLEVNQEAATRMNSIKIIKGTPGSLPVAPTLINTEDIHQYALAHIYVGAGVTSLTQSNITNKVGTVGTPFVTGIMEGMDIDALILQWQSQWEDATDAQLVEFNAWFDYVKGSLEGDPATEFVKVIIEEEAVTKTSNTGAARIPQGTTEERPLDPQPGYLRFNSTDEAIETFNGEEWVKSAGQMLGNANVKAISYNSNSIGENITIPTNTNALSAGPITILDGFTVTVSDNSVWVIV